MSYSGDAAEQVVRMSLEGVEVAAKITGEGAKQVALLLYAILREQKKTSGKARLTNLLRSGKELKVFAVRDQDLQRFCKEAKRYGVLYCVLKDRDATDGITDIMVRAEDASKINRIFERFDLATVDMGSVKSEIERSRAEEEKSQQEAEAPDTEQGEQPMTDQEQEDLLDGLLGPAPEREPQEEPPVPEQAAQSVDDKAFMAALLAKAPVAEEVPEENPTTAETAKSRQSEPTSKPKEPAAQGISEPSQRSRPSVRQELNDIKAAQSERAAASREQKPTKGPQHLAPRKKYKPKRLKEKER